MAHASFHCTVKAPFDIIWETLMDEVENPHSYNPNIKGIEVLERFHDGILRVVSVPDADVREKVIFNYKKGEISSNLVGHPSLVGTIIKVLRPSGAEEHQFDLSSELEWQALDSKVDSMVRRNVERFVMNGLNEVKNRAESIATSRP